MSMSLFKYYDEMTQGGVILYFNGPVSQAMVETLAGQMRTRMRAEDAGVGEVQRVFSVLVEQMQNIVRYSADRRAPGEGVCEEMAHGQVVVGREKDGRFFVACGNPVRAADCTELTQRISKLQGMTPEELKAYYRECRRQPDGGTEKGAGLGFVEMARKADGPLDYAIVPVDAGTSFFSMKVVTQ
ncbi:SiaB family protein kinase [Pseudodesulfovibrio sp.]|uniref:SiaB family protein kinase n=1 Tax=unclassified Pseudodesulfovibrio TaxID=2661612 RepID=UPI003AFFD905